MDKTVQNTVEWLSPPSALYPVITLCHPRFFDKKLMKSALPLA